MRRKVIQIADSTQLISLPRKWCLSNNIKKGDELTVDEKGSQITVSCDLNPKIERAEVNLKDLGLLAPRYIHAMYKRGIDEIKVFYSPSESETIQKILNNETVGFEIIEQGKNYCIIKNVSGHLEGFDGVLRRTFLLLSNMADDCVKALQEKDTSAFNNLILLEKSNNRFTTMCRRYLNKYGTESYDKIGPLYFIVEALENIADQYKYLCKELGQLKPDQLKFKDAYLDFYKDIAQIIRVFQEVFYKNDYKKLVEMAELRKKLIDQMRSELYKVKSNQEFIMLHHAMSLTQKVFNLIGPYFVIAQGRPTQQQP